MSLNQDDAFLQAILEQPDDDTVRLIYADWLEEQGNPRGEFIRVQCALARLPTDDPRRAELEAREATLLAAHRDAWLAPVREIGTEWEFRRGFVEQLTISAPSVLANAEALFALAPVRHMRVTHAQGSGP